MSILDELRQKALEKEAEQFQQASIKNNLENVYQSVLLPKMQLFYDYLNETVKHLNFIEEPILINSYCSRYPQFGELCQKNYKINTDGYSGLADYNRLMQININFFCEGEGSFTYSLESKRLIEAEVAFLHARRLAFTWKNQGLAIAHEIASFTIQRKIPVSFKIEIDYPLSKLKVTINNHENLDFFSKNYTLEQINDNLLDTLVSYLMRRDKRLIKLEICDAHKTAIKCQLTAQHESELSALKNFENDNARQNNEQFKIVNPVKAIFSKFSPKK